MAEGGAGCIGESGVADTAHAADKARSGGETVGGDGAGGGVTGSVGGAGKSSAGEASSASSGAGGVMVGVAGDGAGQVR